MKNNKPLHIPVLLNESIEALTIEKNGIYIDATFGRGGHSEAILKRLGEKGVLIAIDKDAQAVAYANRLFKTDSRFVIEQGSFANIAAIAEKHNVLGQVNGILLDLGVSSPQLEDSARGFSFLQEGPLDMRMDLNQRLTASEWINTAKEVEIANVLHEFGEERFSRRIAKTIVESRKLARIETTKVLADLVVKAVPFRERKKHPATRTFQAIRIYINQELADLKICLEQSLSVLKPQGRLVVISFHSLEDRLVKEFIRYQSRCYEATPHLLVQPQKIQPLLRKIGRSIKPTEVELGTNPRARSAILRIAEKQL